MLGTIIGDIVGSVHESRHRKVADLGFPLFASDARPTDDTVLTLAVAEALRRGIDFTVPIRRWARAYPHAGFGGMFIAWMRSDDAQSYGSLGNGSAMRVSPVGCAFDDLDTVLDVAARSASVTHDHPEGIRGAQAVAAAILVARTGDGTAGIREEVEGFGYDLSRSVEQWRNALTFDVTCRGTVPPAVQSVLESDSVESAVRNAVYIGGDADTLAAIAGGIAAAAFGVPQALIDEATHRLDTAMLAEVVAFTSWLDQP